MYLFVLYLVGLKLKNIDRSFYYYLTISTTFNNVPYTTSIFKHKYHCYNLINLWKKNKKHLNGISLYRIMRQEYNFRRENIL